uniref:Class I SAM-dependent methyltransferase n=1 Tax=Bursaphelenchus xylophilus TaxID=6326 RepID=A0A1I7SN00_BURXY
MSAARKVAARKCAPAMYGNYPEFAYTSGLNPY